MALTHMKTVGFAAVALATALGTAACGSSDSGGDSKKIVVANYGGISGDTIAESIGAPFEKDSGISVQHVGSGVGFVAKVEAQNKSGKITWDAIEGAGGQEEALLASKGFLKPLPTALRSKLEKVSIPNGVTEHGVLLGTTGYVIACNMKKVDVCPSNPAEFWDAKSFPGKRAVVNNPFGAMASALVADGVAPSDVFPMDIDRAFTKLEELRPNVDIWTTSGDQQVQVMRDGQVDMSIMWNGRAKSVIDEGVPLQLEWDGSLANPNYMVVLKGGPNEKAAMDYLEWYGTHPKAQADVARKLAYGMSHREVTSLLNEEEAALLPEGGSNADNQVLLDGDWWADNSDAVSQKWKEFLAG